MKKRLRGSFLSLWLILTFSYAGFTQTDFDSVQVRQTVENYIYAFYKGESDLLRESVHPNLAKRTVKSVENNSDLKHSTFEDMLRLSEVFYRQSNLSDHPRMEIVILDMSQNMASVKLIAEGWIDYIHLARFNNEWKIINVIWEYDTN